MGRHEPSVSCARCGPVVCWSHIIVQADAIGCHVITVTHDLLKKLPLIGRDLEQFSLETVRMFHDDAAAAGYQL